MPIDRAYGFTDLFALVRAGSAWRFDAAGALAEVAANQPRVDYDPVGLAVRGLLVEEAATNGVQNARLEGAVAGSPGTVPTQWPAPSTASTTRSIPTVGVEDGIPYVDVRWVGTPGFTGNLIVFFHTMNLNTPAAAVGQDWTGRFYQSLVGGSLTNIGLVRAGVNEYNGATFLVNTLLTQAPALGPLRNQPVTVQRLLTNAGTNNVALSWQAAVTGGAAIDITVRFAAPQLWQSALAFSPSFPPVGTPAASTRAADDLSMRDIGQWFSPAAGTFVIDWTPGQTTSPANRGLLMLDDTTANNRLRLFMEPSGTAPRLFVASGGVTVVPGTSAGSVAALSRHTLRFSYGPAGYLMSVNGAAPVSVAGALPVNLSRCLLGQGLPGSEFLNGWLGPRLAYYPTQYTDTAAADGLTIRTR